MNDLSIIINLDHVYKSGCDKWTHQFKTDELKRPNGWTAENCCTPDNPCYLNEGGCQKDGDCLGGLVCRASCPPEFANTGASKCCIRRMLIANIISLFIILYRV